MAIPLIQNVEKQDINTSIIAIRRQLEQLYNALGVTESTVSSEDISKSTGTPLGTWASFENDYAPNIEWLQSGTTFNPNTYPALAMYLGGNTVPERFDHSRPSELENITLQTTNQVALYDGVIAFPWYNATGNFYVNEKIIEKASSANSITNLVIPIKKGDTYRVSNLNNITSTTVFAQWFKHPLFIKATPTSSDSDYEGTLNAIREFYVRNNTYSTEERLTGGYWIDGKPIYRKVWKIDNFTDNMSFSGGLSNVETVLTLYGTSYAVSQTIYSQFPRNSAGNYFGAIYQISTDTIQFNNYAGYSGSKVLLILEYTKSTDS